ncbi:MAG: MFS transporter [Firmicutes bacterium]|nr:MFS transporter [Bacillota bacterium]
MSKVPMHDNVKKLIAIRALRSVGQGAMVVDLTLYLKDLHWSGVAIGGVTSAAGLVGAALILVVGILSDRIGRRPFLLVYEALTVISACVASLTTYGVWLVLVIVIAGFGRGQSGAAGPFSPAEQALLARYVDRIDRGRVFSLNNAVGFVGMALGALLGGWPALQTHTAPLLAYRPVFWVVAVLSLVCVAIVWQIREEKTDARPDSSRAESPATAETLAQAERQIRKKENRNMATLAMVNILNGLAVGLTGPMMAYWFSIRYGASTAQIGATLAISFLLTGLFSIVSGRMASRVGMVKSVTWMRVIGSAVMLALPFMPNFALASALFVIRSAVNRGTQGNRNALSASLTRDKRRGLATSINALSMRLPSSLGPTISGYLFDADLLSLPLILTAVLQLVNAGLYQWAFGRMDREGREPAA